MIWIRNSLILLIYFACSGAFASDEDSLKAEIAKRNIRIEKMDNVIKAQDAVIQDCDSVNADLMRTGFNSDAENKRLQNENIDLKLTVKGQDKIIKVLGGVVFTFVAGYVVADLVRGK